MTNAELWDHAHRGVSEAASLITVGWVFPGNGMAHINKTKDCLQIALCAVQELERRAAGVQPAKESA